jgi:flagella basal body P-ring formation protein FlgA
MFKVVTFLLAFFVEIDIQAESLSKETVEKAVYNEVLQKINNVDFRIQVDTWQQNWDSKNDANLAISNISLLSDNKRFKATLTHGAVTKTVAGAVVRLIQLPVLEEAASGDTLISANHIRMQAFDENMAKGDVAISNKELSGFKVRKGRLIKANTPIRKSDIERPLAIKKGDTIRVAYIDPTFEVSTVALAKSDASIGDTVTLEVGTKKNIVQAIVVHEGRAEIRES